MFVSRAAQAAGAGSCGADRARPAGGGYHERPGAPGCLAAAGERAHGGALAAIYETACFPRVGRGGVLEGADTALRRGLVDIALCWVLSDDGLRRSEAAALTWDDITRWDNGSGRLTVRRSKTDATPRTV